MTFRVFVSIRIYVPSSSTRFSGSSKNVCARNLLSVHRVKADTLPFLVATNIWGLWEKVGYLLSVLKFWRPKCVAAWRMANESVGSICWERTRWMSQAMPMAKVPLLLIQNACSACAARTKVTASQHHPCQLKHPWKAVQGLMVMVVYVGTSHQIWDFPGGDGFLVTFEYLRAYILAERCLAATVPYTF